MGYLLRKTINTMLYFGNLDNLNLKKLGYIILIFFLLFISSKKDVYGVIDPAANFSVDIANPVIG